jgi:hypothetical protein
MYAALCISNVSVRGSRGWAGTKERRNQSLIPTRLHQPAPKNSTRARFQAEIPRCEWASLQEGRKVQAENHQGAERMSMAHGLVLDFKPESQAA